MKKNILSKVLSVGVAIGLVLCYQMASAVTVVYTVGAGVVWNSTNLFGTASNVVRSANINSIVISTGSSAGATNLNYAITDFPAINVANGWGAIKKTNSAYASVGSYLTNITKITTNFGSGDGAGNYVTYTNTFTNALYTYTNTVGQTSNSWRLVAAGTVGSNSTATVLSGSFPVIYGLGFTNNNIGKDITITVDYDPNL